MQIIKKSCGLLLLILIQIIWGQRSQNSFSTDEILQLGNQYYKSMDYHSAIKLYRKILMISPKTLEAHYNLAHAYYHIYTGQKIIDKGYLALTIYNYEQILENRNARSWEEFFSHDDIPTLAANNLAEIRMAHNLKVVPRNFFELIKLAIRSNLITLSHGLGSIFIITMFFLTLSFWKSSNKSNQNFSFKKKPDFEKGLSQFFKQVFLKIKTKSLILFVISMSIYLFILGLILWQKWEQSSEIVPYLTRAVINQDSSLREVPQLSTQPLFIIPEGETVLIIETRENQGRSWIKLRTSDSSNKHSQFIEGWMESEKIWTIGQGNPKNPPKERL